MMIYLQFVNYNSWDTVIKGPHVPKCIVDGKTIIEPTEEWDKMIKSYA